MIKPFRMGWQWRFALALALFCKPALAQDPPANKIQQAPSLQTQDSPVLANPMERESYALGADLGHQLRKLSIEVDPTTFGQGLRDALQGDKVLLTDEEVRTAIADLQAEQKRRVAEAWKSGAAENKKVGQEFLERNKNSQGVVTLPSGLQYKILNMGGGARPTQDDTVVCNYRGTLIDGTEFDSSFKRNQPAKFPVKSVIKGWTEALQLMPVGSKWQIFIPSDLAYGDSSSGDLIGPEATLIFEVELISIQTKP